MPITKPPALRPGDRIAVVSPASAFDRDDFGNGIAELRRLGYEPVYDESIFERALFTSGSAERRASAFMQAWADPRIKALIAVRGGYGSVHLLPEMRGWQPQREPKLFIAYSDNTSLLSWLTCHCGITALHGPMLEGRFARGREWYDEASFVALAQGTGRLMEMAPDGVVAIRSGEATGLLYGGTMTQLCASLGTPYAFDPPDGCILFLEDVNERPYRIDRMLTQLRLSGVLGRARALVFGEMRGCDEPGGELRLLDVLPQMVGDIGGPVLFGFPSGHTTKACWTLPLGVQVRVTTAPQPAVVVEESPVS